MAADTQYRLSCIETSEGVNGQRRAVIHAPADAPPGSLESLTRFLQEAGCRVMPGYTGERREHVLRIKDFATDAQLEKMLKVDFPMWEQARAAEEGRSPCPLVVPGTLVCQPASYSGELPDMGSLKEFAQENSTDMAALSYTIGNVGILYSAFNEPDGNGGKNWGKALAPVSYTMSSILLFILNRGQGKSIDEIYPELEQALVDQGMVNPDTLNDDSRAAIKGAAGHAINFMREHPWEVAGLVNMVGAGAHFASVAGKENKLEAIAALGTLTSLAIQTFVPEKGTEGILNFGDVFTRQDGKGLPGLFQSIERNLPIFKPFFDYGRKMIDWIREKPLRAAAGIQMISNIGYAVSAFSKKDEEGNRKVDKGLIATSAAYITGNLFQSLASKKQVAGFDDKVTQAARLIKQQYDLEPGEEAAIDGQITRLAAVLAGPSGARGQFNQYKRGIEERAHMLIDRDRAAHADTSTPHDIDILQGYLPFERHILKESPFLAPQGMGQTIQGVQ